MQQAVLLLDGVDALKDSDTLAYQTLLLELTTFPHLAILTGSHPWVPDTNYPLGVVSVVFTLPDVAQRQIHWRNQLSTVGLSLPDHQLQDLAARFRLTADQIAEAVATAHHTIPWQPLQTLSSSPPPLPHPPTT
ncbi:MAG: ATP-binding protein, partial [Leptolyngbyaceae cyanobacterium SM2_5_2]|nr:ATP-binding protein [Leptolyngbyaceae cyanobacterium SM2_5_2]